MGQLLPRIEINHWWRYAPCHTKHHWAQEIILRRPPFHLHPQFLCCYEGSNKIGDLGCQLILGADWSHLHRLDLGAFFHSFRFEFAWIEGLPLPLAKWVESVRFSWHKLSIRDIDCNKIEDKGCKNLSRAEWKSLKSLNICNVFVTNS